MRRILKKINKRITLTSEEYNEVINYIDELRSRSPESYQLFLERYAHLLNDEYCISLNRHNQVIDDIVNYLSYKPDVLLKTLKTPFDLSLFPVELHHHLHQILVNQDTYYQMLNTFKLLQQAAIKPELLPLPRDRDITFIYEDDNCHKEIGLQTHFMRLGRYQFITRLQSYRYLRRNKAKYDRIEYIGPDKLGGIFTNKEKSIYYWIYLSEKDVTKTRNACRLLNIALYQRGD